MRNVDKSTYDQKSFECSTDRARTTEVDRAFQTRTMRLDTEDNELLGIIILSKENSDTIRVTFISRHVSIAYFVSLFLGSRSSYGELLTQT